MWKILDRLKFKWIKKLKSWSEKSELYPLRWLIRCPYCHFHMTWRWSTGKMKKIYHYYWCNRTDCKWKENIPIDKMHEDYEKLLEHTTPKAEVLKLAETYLTIKIKDKNLSINKMEQWYRSRIRQIDAEIQSIENKIEKLSKPELISKLEWQWSLLEEEKEILNKKIVDWRIIEEDFNKIFEKVKNILLDPLSVRRYGPLKLKQLQVRVLYWDEIFYKKNKGLQTLIFKFFFKWSGWRGSNPQQSAWKAGTLANWVTPAHPLERRLHITFSSKFSRETFIGRGWVRTSDQSVMSRLL